MKLIIELLDRIYTTIIATHDNMIFDGDNPYVAKAIKNGTCLIECNAEDCIEKKVVLNGINEAMNYIDWGQSQDGDAFRHLCASLYRTIHDMPSVTPKNDNSVLEDIKAIINTPIRGTCDYFIVDEIEKYITEKEGV